MKFIDKVTPVVGSKGSDFLGKVMVKDFLSMTKTPVVQRNHEERVMKGQVDYFEDILPQHQVVSVAVYNGDDFEYSGGEVISAGDALVVDGNTRKFFWGSALKSKHPAFQKFMEQEIVVCVKYADTALDIEKWYETFDSNGQIKKASHAMQSAAHLSGVAEERIVKLATMFNKMVRNVIKGVDDTDVAFRAKKVKAFGVEHINDFHDKFSPLLSKSDMSKASPVIGAYRALRNRYGKDKYPAVDEFFTEFLTGSFNAPINAVGEQSCTMYLYNLLMQKGVYSDLNPKSSGDRIEIVAAVIYLYGKRFMEGKKYVPGGRLPVANSQAGALQMMKLFSAEMVV